MEGALRKNTKIRSVTTVAYRRGAEGRVAPGGTPKGVALGRMKKKKGEHIFKAEE